MLLGERKSAFDEFIVTHPISIRLTVPFDFSTMDFGSLGFSNVITLPNKWWVWQAEYKKVDSRIVMFTDGSTYVFFQNAHSEEAIMFKLAHG